MEQEAPPKSALQSLVSESPQALDFLSAPGDSDPWGRWGLHPKGAGDLPRSRVQAPTTLVPCNFSNLSSLPLLPRAFARNSSPNFFFICLPQSIHVSAQKLPHQRALTKQFVIALPHPLPCPYLTFIFTALSTYIYKSIYLWIYIWFPPKKM